MMHLERSLETTVSGECTGRWSRSVVHVYSGDSLACKDNSGTVPCFLGLKDFLRLAPKLFLRAKLAGLFCNKP